MTGSMRHTGAVAAFHSNRIGVRPSVWRSDELHCVKDSALWKIRCLEGNDASDGAEDETTDLTGVRTRTRVSFDDFGAPSRE